MYISKNSAATGPFVTGVFPGEAFTEGTPDMTFRNAKDV